MTTKSLLRDILLTPFSWLYGAVIGIRNLMFDAGILPSTKFDTPVVVVGNISVGGTGKTPLTEHLISVLSDKFKVAVVSRGYKRSTSGYVLSTQVSTPSDIGDEPYQMKRKFPNITLAVDSKRVRAIKKLLASDERPDIFLLDDAYQHRYVSADISILLVDYNNLIYNDKLLPVGRLREYVSAKNRADIVVVTKCPADISPMDLRVITADLKLFSYQNLYFTTMEYEAPKPVFSAPSKESYADCAALALSGIAQPATFEKHVDSLASSMNAMRFSDHHNFTEEDYEKIKTTYNSLEGNKKVIFVTEKDAVRMMNDSLFPESLKSVIYYIPMKVRFISYLKKDEQTFNSQIISYVTKNRSYMRLS